MQFWITDAPVIRPEAERAPDGSTLRETPAYLEYGFPLEHLMPSAEPGDFVFVYWLRLSEFDFFLGTCWGHAFDVIDDLCTHPKLGAGVRTSAAEGWPAFFTWWSSGQTGVGTTRLLRFVDPDDANPVWMLGRVLGNVDLRTVPDLFAGRSQETLLAVIDETIQLIMEVREVNVLELPNLLERIGKSASQWERQQVLGFLRGQTWVAQETLGSAFRRWILGA